MGNLARLLFSVFTLFTITACMPSNPQYDGHLVRGGLFYSWAFIKHESRLLFLGV